MFCQFPFPVFLNHTPDLFHSLNHKHPGISKVVFRAVSILMQECIILSIKGVYGIQQPRQMVIQRSTPDKCIAVCVGFDFSPVNEKFLQREQAFFFQASQKLVIQFIQNFPGQLFPFKIIESIPPWFLPFRQPDKCQISFT